MQLEVPIKKNRVKQIKKKKRFVIFMIEILFVAQIYCKIKTIHMKSTKKPRLISQGYIIIPEAEGRPRGSGGLGPQ
jgi:hypothetical protein